MAWFKSDTKLRFGSIGLPFVRSCQTPEEMLNWLVRRSAGSSVLDGLVP